MAKSCGHGMLYKRKARARITARMMPGKHRVVKCSDSHFWNPRWHIQ